MLWRRSGRPWRGQIIRAYVAITAIAGLLMFGTAPVSWILAGVVAAAALAVPYFVELYLRRWERRVRAADKRQADEVLSQLRSDRWIRNLAPHAWSVVQEGILQMHRRDGRAAAKCFADAQRLAKGSENPTPLISAEAHALMLAGDRRPARELLEKLDGLDALSPRDHLDLGLALLQEAGRNRDAIRHLERAQERLGEHPRVLAALALGKGKSGAEDEGWAHFQAAEAAVEEGDELTAELLKRARKALRDRIKREQKKARRAGSERAQVEDPARPPGTKKGRRKNKRKKDKKNKKNKDKAQERAPAVEPKPLEKPSAAPPARPPVPAPTPAPAPTRTEVPRPAAAAPRPPAPSVPPTGKPTFAPPPGTKTRVGPLFEAPTSPNVKGGVAPLLPPPPSVATTRPKPPPSPAAAPEPADDGWGDALDDVVVPSKPRGSD